MPDPENGNVQVRIRRRRTRRHRRNRIIRRWLSVAWIAIIAAGASSLALKYFSPSLFRASQSATPKFEQAALRLDAAAEENVPQVPSVRPVYPYSVVAGGVEDAKELKWVAEHDPVVAAHYAGFDYEHAQVVRLTLARTVYVSYRIGSRIYWTRRRVTLHKGEKLITDGKMVARTRCANRVEEKPQQEAASPVEPPVEKFDEPVRAGQGTAMQAPQVPFQSALLARPQMPGLEPTGPLSLYDPFVGGNFISTAIPPLGIEGVCGPVKKKDGTSGGDFGFGSAGTGKQKKVGPCGESGVVPEPGTWLLLATGLAAIYWQARRKFSRA